ncbi:MAG TPA: hypothetical protein VIL22_02835 [Paenibacillaceae bacterium]
MDDQTTRSAVENGANDNQRDEAEATIRSLKRKVRALQLILTVLAFLAAMNSTMMAGSMGFILWYAVLGGVVFYFYRKIWLVLLLSFVPAFGWMIVYEAGSMGEAGIPGMLLSSLIAAGIHTVFALVGMAIAWLAAFRKAFPGVLAAVLAVGILIIYDGFNGNPASKWLAEQTVRSYLAKTYPGEELVIRDGYYNFKSSSYEFRVVAVGTAGEDGQPEEYYFGVRGIIPKVVWDTKALRNS